MIFGKARWFIIGCVLFFTLQVITQYDWYLANRINGVSATSELKASISETRFEDVQSFSINENGIVAVTCDIGYEGYAAVFNIDTKEKSFAYANDILSDKGRTGLYYDNFTPGNVVITDDNDIYAVRTFYDDPNGYQIITHEQIIRLTEDYKYVSAVLDIEYDPSDNCRKSELTRLHYHDGVVTFAVINKGSVKLYKIDTVTGKTSVSRDYQTDANGTFTSVVIPIDDAFLFVRSDGNVYRTGFDEDLTDVIYHYDNSGSCPYITDAVMMGNQLYAFNKFDPDKFYRITDGVAEKIADVNGSICYIDSYGSDKLALCLSDGLLVYSDGAIREVDTLLQIDPHYLIYLREFIEPAFTICFYCLIINLIIRKKTLFYKQLIATLPVFTIVAVVIAYNIYTSSTENISSNIKSEMNIITDFGARYLEDYDLSSVMKADEDTGMEYQRLLDTLNEISTPYYKFEIVSRLDNTHAAVLASEEETVMPYFTTEEIFSEEDAPVYDDVYYVVNIIDILASESRKSDITAYQKINDKGGCGTVYLKVTTDNYRLMEQRSHLLAEIWVYVALIIVLFTMTNLLISLYIKRMMKKATKVVRRIASGDLSARIEYRSRDEMGDICNEVNTMGQSLERLFDEKDRTEKFYYKFVPEQFRTLLGKENFIDLKLGDSDNRELTVLFLDIRAFSLLSEKMTTQENFEFVNIIYGIAGPIIRANNGFIDKYIGDAIMALFESPDDAVKSGIDIYRAIVLDPSTSAKLGVDQINIGIGIHTGMAQIGIVGEEERLSGTVISDTVNLASRLESLTKQYKTAMLVSKDTIDRMAGHSSLDLRWLGNVQVAGVNEVIQICEVLDCLSDDERQKRHANISSLNEAIDLFGKGDVKSASGLLQSLTDSGKDDHVTGMYLKYISELPSSEKKGVFRFTRK
ncbi:MAG: adenylate/guanylate cyclase domain-containing protein [Clostridiales bacterium]|nr:adenylate/guanylate cyclase domain-containing protein [Clostridiales bacterium]